MKKYFTFLILLISSLSLTYYFVNRSGITSQQMPRPEEGEENHKNKERWYELIHKAAPGTDWRKIEQKNRFNNIKIRRDHLFSQGLILNQSQAVGQLAIESYANGAINGTWLERGSANVAGNVKAVDYVPSTDNLYVVSDGGTLWRRGLSTGAWTPLNKDLRFKQDILRVIVKPSGGKRILVSVNNQILYSDNEGQDFTSSTGITFPVEWGGNNIASLLVLNDAAKTMYCLTRPLDPTPWQPRYWLYKSTNLGETFTQIYTFSFGDDNTLSLNNPYNTNDVYAADTRTNAGKVTLFGITGSTVTQLNAVNGPSDARCILKGTRVSGTTTLYILINNSQVYKSTNKGASWIYQNNLPEDSWDRLAVAMDDPAKIFVGGVNSFRSTNSGVIWTLVNNWYEYYGFEATKLHADIMEIASFRRANGTPFMIINNHGGCYISNDNMVNNSNLSLSGLNTAQYYDVLTDPDKPTNLFAGSQDQGLQRNTSATTAGVLNFQQVISGDYGYLALSGSPKHLWTQYPYGNIYYYDDPAGGVSLTWKMPGMDLPNYGWLLPIANTPSIPANEVLMAGGNISGGPGSYLIKLKATTSPPYAISTSQYNFNFRANSNNTFSGITAIDAAKTNTSRMYVATEDGTFFYTSNGGTSWTKSASFTGPTPWYLYGACVLSSHETPNLVWFAGSGYSSPPVFKSTNGGQTFTPMSNGLPPTLVYEMVENPSGTMLFAATEAGPYVYIISANQWYPLLGADNPLQSYTTVQYIALSNIVRFGTYGRGIWDFKVDGVPTITSLLPTAGAPGAGVAIKGTKFDNVTAVRFNGVAATTIYKAGSTLLYASVPAGATTGRIEVETNAGAALSATSFTVAPIKSSWVAKPVLATGRVQHASIATNGKIYVFGGRSISATLNTLEIYNPSANVWTAGANMPVATRGMAATLGSNGSIYMFGGITSAQVSTAYRYTPSTNTWTKLASMPGAVFEAAAAATSNGKIYLFGGEPSTASGTSTIATRIYDIATNTWSSALNMPVGVHQHSAVTGADGNIYLIGGRAFSVNAPLGILQIYTPATNSWKSGASMLIPKVQFGATLAANNNIYVIGGKATEPNSTAPFFHTVEIYNPATNRWSTGPVIPVPAAQQTAVKLNDNLYALSGTDNTIRNYNFQLIPVPVAPTTLSVVGGSSSQINLKWKDVALNEATYVVERGTTAAGPFVSVATIGANTISYTNTGLSPGTTYHYRVKATNTTGSSVYSNVASAATSALLTNAITKTNKTSEIIPTKNTLSVQPNPVFGTTNVTFSIDEQEQNVRLEIYNANGNFITELYKGPAEKGKRYQFRWNALTNVGGIYFCRLTTRKHVHSLKIVLLR